VGGIWQCPSYLSSMTKADVQKEFKEEIDIFVPETMDFLLCEVRIGTYNILTVGRNIGLNRVLQYYKHIEEMEWAIEEFLKTDLPVASTPVTHDSIYLLELMWHVFDNFILRDIVLTGNLG
jgi:hypothetical protein